MTISDLINLIHRPYQSEHIERLSNMLNTDLPVYLLGRNEDADVIAQHYKFAAIIDDFVPLPLLWQQHKVIRLEDVPKDAIVINGVTNSRPRYAQEVLLSKGYKNSFYLADFCYALKHSIPMLKFVTDAITDLKINKKKWQKLYDALEDQESKKTLIDILKYKITGDPRQLKEYEFRPEQQYFEDFLNLSNETFIDGGGYQGETTIEFIKRYPDYKQVLFFEPVDDYFKQAKYNLAEYDNIIYYDVGLSDKIENLSFHSGKNSSVSFTNTGDTSGQCIQVKPLDQLAKIASFIKLDLEGWELNALIGAQQLIQKNKPKLALGLYHSPKDMNTVFEWLEKNRFGYKYRLRHYTQSWYETVLYAY